MIISLVSNNLLKGGIQMGRCHRIDINPNIMFGKPVIKNTRITVEHILRKLASKLSVDDIIKDHPHLKPEDIYAAQNF